MPRPRPIRHLASRVAPALALALLAVGCGSTSSTTADGPGGKTSASWTQNELRFAVHATFGETYRGVWDGLDHHGWNPSERIRTAEIGVITGRRDDGTYIQVRMKLIEEQEILVGVKTHPPSEYLTTREIAAEVFDRLEAHDPEHSEHDPFEHVPEHPYRERFR